MSPGSAPTLLMRLPSTTMASLRADGFPEPSISVPLRMTSVFLAALMGPPAKLLRLRDHTAARQVAVLRLAHAYSLSPRGRGGGGGVGGRGCGRGVRAPSPHPSPRWGEGARIGERRFPNCSDIRGEAMRGDDIADLLAAVDMGAHHGADVAVKLGGAAVRLGLGLGAQIGAFRPVDLDKGAAERHLHALVMRQSGIEVAAGSADAVGKAGGIERRL